MSDTTPPPPDEVIRVTREEATSRHVEDLLKRQMSLRGETGVSRSRRRWYYQNWFVFSLAGTLAAVGAWRIIEPYFDDMDYLQGPVEQIAPYEPMPDHFVIHGTPISLGIEGQGSVTLRGQQIWFLKGAKEMLPGGGKAALNLSQVRPGQEIGVYLEYVPLGPDSLAFGHFVTTSPRPQSAARAAMALPQLHAQSQAAALFMIPLAAGLIGLAIGAVDGAVCRLLRRALLAGAVGLLVGFVGGFVSNIIGSIVYTPLTHLAAAQGGSGPESMTPFGFLIQVTGRAFGWAVAGMAMGLGQGIALRSGRLLLYGFLGGVVGGLIGGLLFDPIDLLILGPDKPSAEVSRLVGLATVGLSVGAMIGIVELLAREAWLRMVQGPLAGKEFLLFKEVMKIGSSPRSDIYLFNDPGVADHHANLRVTGSECEIESVGPDRQLLVNQRPVRNARLRHGDQIGIGRTVFEFQRSKG